MKNILVYIGLISMSITFANAQEKSEGRELAELTFETVDTTNKGYVNQGDMEQLRDKIFVSVDSSENKRIDLDEFLTWDYGFANIAADEGKSVAYRAALNVVFSFWDRDGDGEITETEHRKSMIADFKRANLNNDEILDNKEFLNGLSVLVAIRSVIETE